MLIIFSFLAAVLTLGGGWLLLRTLLCSTAITGTFVRCETYKSKGIHDVVPVFRYEVDGFEYVRPIIQSYSKTYVESTFIPGDTYTVYICKAFPKLVSVSRRPQLIEIVALLMGLLMSSLVLFG